MTRIVLVGTGNVAWHLFEGLRRTKDLAVIQVIGRSAKALAPFSKATSTGDFNRVLTDADLYIIAVSDDAISTVSQLLKLKDKLIVHTSGSVPKEALAQGVRRGVFYPLQSFSRDRSLNLREVPLCIEAELPADLALLRKVAGSLSEQVREVTPEERRQLHLAAVFANNFTNHCCHLAHEVLKQRNLPFRLLLPLIRETSEKLREMTPYDAQTGPARRNDRKTLSQHQALLQNGIRSDVYTLLTKSIQQTHAEEL